MQFIAQDSRGNFDRHKSPSLFGIVTGTNFLQSIIICTDVLESLIRSDQAVEPTTASKFRLMFLIYVFLVSLSAGQRVNICTRSSSSKQHNEALPGVLGNRGTRAFISGEQGNKGQILRGTNTILGNREHKKQVFNFCGTGEQAHLFQRNKGTGTPLGEPP